VYMTVAPILRHHMHLLVPKHAIVRRLLFQSRSIVVYYFFVPKLANPVVSSFQEKKLK
jgi:hypothetical protein